MPAASEPTRAGELVVLVHGLGPGRLPMRPLARRLARAGYQTLNWYYPCLRYTLEAHGRRLHELLESLSAEHANQRLHLVTYSMGSIVARFALELGRPSKLGRIVMLAPPLRGSHWATLLGPISRCCVRTIDQLAARPNSFVNSLAEPQGLEIGVIAARYDLLVHADSSQLAAARDRIVLPGIHTFLPMQRDTAEQVQHFLAHGNFWRGDGSRPATFANAEAKPT
ncbi:MAG TPA: hypothetical protein VHB99_06205 [Pirellulales bacterium]|nr:hypothetical protein [Pirellulales bacterium]